jgi:hypothetical protein
MAGSSRELPRENSGRCSDRIAATRSGSAVVGSESCSRPRTHVPHRVGRAATHASSPHVFLPQPRRRSQTGRADHASPSPVTAPDYNA